MSKNIQHTYLFKAMDTFFTKRMVFEKKEKNSEPYEESADINPEKKEGGKKDKATLKAEYEKARDDVRTKLQKYVDKESQYKVFLDYANERLNQVDRDLKRFDVLDESTVRENMKKLQSILVFTLDDELKNRRKEVIAKIESEKKAAVKRLEERAKEHYAMLAEEVKPETLKFAQTKFAEVKAQINVLYNLRIRAVDTSMSKAQDPKWGDMATRTETLMIYLQGVEDGLGSTEEGSTSAEAEKMYKDYETSVRGQYCIEEAKQGVSLRKINTTCLEYKVKYWESRKDIYDAFDKLSSKYKKLMEGVKGDEAYKVQAVIYGQFLDEVRVIYRQLVAPNQDVPSRNFALATVEQLDVGKKPNEKKWDKVEKSGLQFASYSSENEYVMKSGEDVHYLAGEGEFAGTNGIVIGSVHGGNKVTLVEQAPIKVAGKEYLHIEVRDKKGNVTSDGWVRASALAPSANPEAKPEKKNKKAVDA